MTVDIPAWLAVLVVLITASTVNRAVKTADRSRQ